MTTSAKGWVSEKEAIAMIKDGCTCRYDAVEYGGYVRHGGSDLFCHIHSAKVSHDPVRAGYVGKIKELEYVLKKEQARLDAYDKAKEEAAARMAHGMRNRITLDAIPEPAQAEPETGRDEPIRIDNKKLSPDEMDRFLKAFRYAVGYNADFAWLLNTMAKIHVKKNQDYASDDNRYSNFEYAAQMAAPFSDPVDKVFATMIGIKLARISELKKGKFPNFESIDDSHLDECVYSTLWASYRKMKARQHEERIGCSAAEGRTENVARPDERSTSPA